MQTFGCCCCCCYWLVAITNTRMKKETTDQKKRGDQGVVDCNWIAKQSNGTSGQKVRCANRADPQTHTGTDRWTHMHTHAHAHRHRHRHTCIQIHTHASTHDDFFLPLSCSAVKPSLASSEANLLWSRPQRLGQWAAQRRCTLVLHAALQAGRQSVGSSD